MINTEEIMEAIRALINKEILELKGIYDNLVPEKFLRPSLLIQPARTVIEDASAHLIHVEEYLTLTIFDVTDDYTNTDSRSQLQLQAAVVDVFQRGVLPVRDRYLKVRASSGGREWDRAYIDIQLEFWDSRGEEKKEAPLMEQMETSVTVNKMRMKLCHYLT